MAAAGGLTAGFHPSRVLVRFKPGSPHNFEAGSGNARALTSDGNLFAVDNPPGLSVPDVLARYKTNPNVQRAEPDYIVQAIATPTDPMWGQQWDMVKINAPAAWDTQTDAGDIVVAIVDTGIDYTHPDLVANLWTDSDNITHGFTCIGGACTPGGADDFGHGAHVAGTIGAAANNAAGIAGLNWNVKLLSVKFLNSGGSGAISDAVVAFQKILALKQSGVNIRVTSNSWGGGGFTQELKDAMLAVEAAGIINICAAGNSGQNVEVAPAYPAAYDNRGIVSVLASDLNDVGAGFTNYGLASVDIAAPGVNTLSTVPTTGCALCDPSGYKVLSGTSMATPHVSGVAAALLHQRPGLTAAQARDILLDPASYDPVADTRAKATSTGGRLNFPKTLANPRLGAAIVLNNFPTLAMGPNVTASSGGNVTLSATANDADPADVPNLRMVWDRSISTATQWLFGNMLGQLFPAPGGASSNFTAPVIARAATVPYTAGVADNRGGGAAGIAYVTVNPSSNPGGPPAGSLSISAASLPVGGTLNVTYSVSDPQGQPVNWDLWAAGLNGASGFCCYSGTTAGLTFNSAGVWRIRTQAIDRELNTSDRPSAVVTVGNAAGVPPIAKAFFDKLSGPAPLTVNVDMSASSDPDGTVNWYYFLCNNGFAAGTHNPVGSCTFNTPGSYWVELQIQDNSGFVDLISEYVVVTPAGGSGAGDTTPPTVNITNPTANASVSGPVDLKATAGDASGIQKVAYYLDSTANNPIGTATVAPYTVSWNPSGVPSGPHTLYAVATDGVGNPGTSPGVPVTIPAPPVVLPVVTITNPVGPTVPRKGTVTITATLTNTPTFGVGRVEISVDNVLKCSPAQGPTNFNCVWHVPNPPKSYQLKAVGFDKQNVAGTPATLMVTAK